MSTHHAYVYIAPSITAAQLSFEASESSVDCVHYSCEAFGIADARMLTATAQSAPVAANKRQFVIQFDTITSEAQNALLKLFEDPPETAVFHVVVPRIHILLPTVQSRLHVVQTHPSHEHSDTVQQYVAFKDSTIGERMTQIADHTKQKDQIWIRAIAAGAANDTALNPQTRLLVDQWIGARGAAKKMLLEELALSL